VSRRWLKGVIATLALALGAMVAPGVADAGRAGASAVSLEPFLVATTFKLHGSNGYSILAGAVSVREDGRGSLNLAVRRGGRATFYRAPARVTPTMLQADLGSLGEIDVVFRSAGPERAVHARCGGFSEPFEPGVYEGLITFDGEEGYTRANVTSAQLLPAIKLQDFCDGGSGSGEVTGGDDLPGGRLRGFSAAHGRVLKFQVNKNRPASRTVLTASVRERHDGVLIQRSLQGTYPARAFSFDRSLSGATLSPRAPFSGSASLTRGRNSAQPLWRGDLSVDFLGRSNVPLAGPDVFVSLVHARFTRSDGPEAEIGF
jgi:hypothetical protein